MIEYWFAMDRSGEYFLRFDTNVNMDHDEQIQIWDQLYAQQLGWA